MSDLIKEYSVSEIVKGIKNILEKEYFYIKIKGEVTNLKKHPSGHIYFSLKDEDAMINVVMFKWYSEYCKVDLKDGIEVVVGGKLTIYKERSNYQILAETINFSGSGNLLKIIQERKEKLAKEGLFDINRKRNIPRLPKSIGIITSESGAALQDILARLKNRTPIELSLYPVLMQGKNSSNEIIEAINYFNNLNNEEKPIVVVITRGGGSTEDLMSFNDENLVRAVANSKIPIISAIGHEIDWTLIDYASDLRLPTPTSVAEYLTISKQEAYDKLNKLNLKFCEVLFRKNGRKMWKLNKIIESFLLKKSGRLLKNIHILELFGLKLKYISTLIFESYKKHKLSFNSINLNKVIKLKLNNNLEKFNIISLKLENYLNKYPILFNKKTGEIIKLRSKIIQDDSYILRFPDGEIEIKVVKNN